MGDFSNRVFEVVRRIPRGKVASYGQVGRLIGAPRSARYVGYALHANPDPGAEVNNIPCHRVAGRLRLGAGTGRMTMKQGYVQVYTGDGKGKTTAAVGLAMRAAAAGLRVYFCQFMKYGPTGELDAFRLFGDRIVAEQFGTGGELSAPDPEDDAQAARRGLAAAREAVLGGAFDVVVLDEANVADSLGYFEPDALVDLALERPETVELVVTGRGASGTLMAVADLVTEMREVKHYYEEGVIARRGIEF